MADRKMYTREYKLEVLELARTSGKINAVLERELGLYGGQIGAWQRAFAREGQQAFVGTGHQTDTDTELQRLKREVEILRQERDILKKAVAIFSAPPNRS
jgi:transposase